MGSQRINRGGAEAAEDIWGGTKKQECPMYIAFPSVGIRQKLWGRLSACGGLLTRLVARRRNSDSIPAPLGNLGSFTRAGQAD